MSFLEEIGFIETAEQEAERLARDPEGSDSHALSKLPVNIDEVVQDLIIELPRKRGVDRRLVVVPIKYRGGGAAADSRPRPRHDGWWACAVVHSDDPSYRAGGNRLSVATAELVRGTRIDLGELLP